MGFASGSISFRRYNVVGDAPAMPDEALLEKLLQHALKESELDIPEEVAYGWNGGRHLLDAQFSFEHNVFADCIQFAIRIDTNKIPSDLKKAYQLMEEEAAAASNPSGFISKNQKRDAKDATRMKLDEELRTGRFRRGKMYPVLWDLTTRTLYCSAGSSVQEKLHELFERTFGLTLEPLSSGTVALRLLESRGRRREYEDLKPTRFVIGPAGEGQPAEYPWVLKGPEAKDFLGNEFLLWLWHEADHGAGEIQAERNGSPVSVTLMIDRSLDLDCAFGESGRDTLKAVGPTRMPEALDALRSGKVPRKAGMILEAQGLQFSLNFNAESLSAGGLKLPDVEEADSPRTLFEERIALLRDFCQSLDSMYDAFLKVRTGGTWERTSGTMRKWINQSARQATASQAVAVA